MGNALLSSAPVGYVKGDFNRCFTEAGRPGKEHQQKLWIEHVGALCPLIDRLRGLDARVPRLRRE